MRKKELRKEGICEGVFEEEFFAKIDQEKFFVRPGEKNWINMINLDSYLAC